MSAIQSTLSFRVRKRAPSSFYPSKPENESSERASPKKSSKSVAKNEVSPPKIRKLVELSSDDENVDLNNVVKSRKPVKRSRYRVKPSKSSDDEESSDSECSPSKIRRMVSSARTKCKDKQEAETCSSDDVKKESEDLLSARLALHSAYSNNLPGREEELKKLNAFLVEHCEEKKSGTIYISGPPGTGKTACLSNILDRTEIKQSFTEVYVNCTTMKSAGSIFGRICQELKLKTSSCNEKGYLKAIDKHLVSKHKMILLVLDEIDQLCSKKQSVLYTIFEWPSRANSQLVLVGVANALDLTDRLLPRLQARCDLRPALLNFPPYSKQQIVDIFTDRLRKQVSLDLFSPAAIQMLAAKVAAISGDVRRALDIGRRVVELSSPKVYSRCIYQQPSKASVGVSQVMSVLNSVYGAVQRLEVDVDDSFPLQQKLLVCSLLLILTKGKNKDVTVGRLHDVYKRVCMKRNILPVDNAEFASICGLVETRGIVQLTGKREFRTRKITLQWDETEVTNALRDKQMISEILNDVSCL